MLKVENLSFSYGKIRAVSNVNFELKVGEIFAIIGANGAGKSSLMKCISGLLQPQSGCIYLANEKLPVQPHKIVERGISLVPEGRWIFPNLTVEENLLMGGYIVKERTPGLERSYQLFPRLAERKKQRAGTMSGGEQQMLAIGRSLMGNPKLLLLDEPSLGLAPNLVQLIFDLIRDINRQGVTILLIEQNANMALKVADYGYVLETGRITLHGPAKELRSNEEVKRAYLGNAHS